MGKIRSVPRVLHQTSGYNARNMVLWYSSKCYNTIDARAQVAGSAVSHNQILATCMATFECDP